APRPSQGGRRGRRRSGCPGGRVGTGCRSARRRRVRAGIRWLSRYGSWGGCRFPFIGPPACATPVDGRPRSTGRELTGAARGAWSASGHTRRGRTAHGPAPSYVAKHTSLPPDLGGWRAGRAGGGALAASAGAGAAATRRAGAVAGPGAGQGRTRAVGGRVSLPGMQHRSDPDPAAVADLLGMLAYGELLAFDRMAADARLAPDLRRRAVLSEMAGAEMANYRLLARRLTELGVEPAD